eukprot:scaffold290226_cov17-Prasinocladus_malaysianus.AAC.1
MVVPVQSRVSYGLLVSRTRQSCKHSYPVREPYCQNAQQTFFPGPIISSRMSNQVSCHHKQHCGSVASTPKQKLLAWHCVITAGEVSQTAHGM